MSDALLQKLETLIAHQEKQIADLSEIVIAQGRDVERLKLRLDHALGKIDRLEQSVPEGREGLSVSEQAALDKPPHY